MKSKEILLIAIAVLMVGCAPKLSFSWTQPDYSAKKFSKIAVFTASKNLGTSGDYQNNVVALLKSKGYNAVKCFDLYPPTKKDFEEGELEKILLEAGVDAVLTTLVVEKEKSVEYVQGNYGYPYGGYYGFGSYYNYRYAPMYSNPGYYNETKTYILENNLFSLDDKSGQDDLIWVSQSVIKDPSNSFTEKYAKLIVESLISQSIINK